MSLYKRLHDVQAAPGAGAGAGVQDTSTNELKTKIHQAMLEELGPLLYSNTLSEEQLERRVRELVQQTLLRERAPLSAADKQKLISDITDDVLGYGPIDPLLKDDEVSDIMVNAHDNIYVERNGVMEKSEITFMSEAHARRIIDKIVSQVGRRIDDSNPMCDARLPDGSRVNAMIHPLAVPGPFMTIRKFGKERMKVEDLLRNDTMTPVAARFLQACIVGRLNIVVSGGSGTGKTTTLNILSSFIPSDERIITVEDAKELQLHQDHVLALESRPPNVDGKGEISIRDLVKNTLRMRPDRIVVGECRGGEALDMLQAMNTGHDGSITTVHANGPKDALTRIETLVLMSGFDLPMRAIREQMAAALDVVVHMARLRDGSRRITHISEVQGMEGDTISMSDIFVFDYSAGMDDAGKFRGHLKPTGIKPKFTEKLADFGIKLPKEIFEPNLKSSNELAAGAKAVGKPAGGSNGGNGSGEAAAKAGDATIQAG